MKLNTLLLISALLLLGSQGCETDVDINGDYKATPVVYGLIDYNQPVQRIRIFKTFQNAKGNAYDYAKITDSLYFKKLSVKLINENSGAVITLNKDNSIPMNPGVFASDSNFMYITSSPLDKNATYKLEITDLESGQVFTAKTNLVDTITWRNPTPALVIPFEVKGNQNYGIAWVTGKGARSYEAQLRMHYTEFHYNDQGQLLDSIQKFIDYVPQKTMITNNLLGGDRMSYSITQYNFFNFLLGSMKAQYNIKRRAYRVDFRMYGASEELNNYIFINTPSFGVVPKNTQYTNISNGLGIFSSRSLNEIKDVPLSATMQNEMKNSTILKPLNFI